MPRKTGISEGSIDYKVRGGKLIRMRVKYSGNRIEEVRINGDFFIHPEEAIEELETSLGGLSLEEAFEAIRCFSSNVEMIGVSSGDLISALKLAVKNDF